VALYKGLFPLTAGPVADRKFSFVHLDVDLYESTKASLEWFYPRLSPGAVVMCHDYDHSGVRKAVDEFLADKPEIAIHQPAGGHCLIVKH
jgi:predicted O-methyltransferase YrrM